MRLILPNLHPWATPLDPPAARAWELGWALLAAAMTDAMDDAEDDREPEAEEKPEPWTECGTCGGSGGGDSYWRCQECAGRGTVRNESWWDDRAAAEADAAYDRFKDERAERAAEARDHMARDAAEIHRESVERGER